MSSLPKLRLQPSLPSNFLISSRGRDSFWCPSYLLSCTHVQKLPFYHDLHLALTPMSRFEGPEPSTDVQPRKLFHFSTESLTATQPSLPLTRAHLTSPPRQHIICDRRGSPSFHHRAVFLSASSLPWEWPASWASAV